jgi:RNA polymerase sigma-70 factor, ECF subfamily
MSAASDPDDHQITELLRDWANPDSRDRLVALLYPELRRIAAARLRRERSGHTLQPTSLVNEVFLQLMRSTDCDFPSRGDFFAIVSEKMRRILVDHARKRKSLKRGGDPIREGVDCERLPVSEPFEQWLEIDDLFEELEKVNERAATVFRLHYFMGLTFEEIAQALQIHKKTAQRDYNLAHAWLFAALYARRGNRNEPGSGGKT